MATTKSTTSTASADETPAVESPAIPEETKLDSSVEKPSTTAPGDGPADTTDPTETASSVTPNPDETAIVAGTVNAVKPTTKAVEKKSTGQARVEKYEATKPDGSVVKVERNIDTGVSKIVD
jgi:hypothetical protein